MMDHDAHLAMLKDHLVQIRKEHEENLRRGLAEDIRRGNKYGQEYFSKRLEELHNTPVP